MQAATTTSAVIRDARVFDIVEEFWSPASFGEAHSRAGRELDAARAFEHEFLEYTGLRGQAAFVPSARKGLQYLLEQSTEPRRTEVIVPAFCCDVVAEAILAAGKRPLLVDSGATPGSLDLEQCEETLRRPTAFAIVLPHLYGLPLDCRGVVASARSCGVLVCADLTQTLRATLDGEPLGSGADFSLHSFNAFKPVCLCGGGMLVVNEGAQMNVDMERIRTRDRAPSRDAELAEMDVFARTLHARRAEVYEWRGTSLKARVRGGLRKLPAPVRSGLRRVINRFRSAVERGEVAMPSGVGAVRASLGSASLRPFDGVVAQRQRNLGVLADGLAKASGARVLQAPAGAGASPLFAKLMLEGATPKETRRLQERLLAAGFAGGPYHYEKTIDQVKIGRKCAVAGRLTNAHRAAASSFDLPIHQNMASEDVQRMARAVAEAISR
jgi:dTDP-4-amino-4,6-dideoxygalactose transaminase